MSRNFYYLIAIAALCFLFQVELAAQCAMCKQAAESTMRSDPKSLARSLNSGILYLMAVPYLLIAFIFRKQLAQLYRRFFRKGIKPAEENS